jgi:mannosyltransferase OCH1-like enzyme
MIPKKIHLIWLGGEVPGKFQVLVDRIKSINSDYEIKEWNDSNIDFELINQNLFNNTQNLGAKSDILRFEVLNRYGGVYMDYDFYQVKNFDSVLDCDFFASSDDLSEKQVWNSIVGSVAGHPICKKFLDGLKDVSPIGRNEIHRTMNDTGPYYLERVYEEFRGFDGVCYPHPHIFYSFPKENRANARDLTEHQIEYLKSFINEKSIALHIHTTMWQY